MLPLIFLALLTALVVPLLVYYAWMHIKTKESWGLILNSNYQPKISLIIPTYNESSVICKKLENTQQVDYSNGKLQIILVDSASTDDTLCKCRSFLEKDSLRFPIRLFSEEKRMGKSHALNKALEYAEGEIIAISDADSFLEPNSIVKAVSFFADPSVGAVTGREELVNLKQTIHTLSEGLYRKFYYTLRLGESKVHSTLIFQGELSLFRRSAFEKFEDRAGYSDDTGTVINIVSHGYRCIFVPEAVFHDTAAYSLRGRLALKSRRAQHLVAGIMESLKLKAQGRLPLPSAIVLFNLYTNVVSPWIFLLTTITLVVLCIQNFWYLLPLVLLPFLFEKSRVFMISYLTSNIALIIGLIRCFAGKKEASWRKVEEMRSVHANGKMDEVASTKRNA